MLGLLVVALLLAGLVVGTLVPWRLGLALRARGDAPGAWALAGGAELLAFALTLAAARGTPFLVDVRAFGRTLLRRAFPSPEPAAKPERPKKIEAARPLRERYARLSRHVDPLDLLLFLASERKRFAVRDLEGSVSLGLADVALAGQIAGLLAVLSALGSPFGRLRHEIDWSGREHLECSVSLSIRFSPLLLVLDTARFVVSSWSRKRGRRAASAPRPTPASQRI